MTTDRHTTRQHATNCSCRDCTFRADITRILGFTTLRGTQHQNVALAIRRTQEWQSERTPITTGERGGSSSPREVEERQEDRKVASQASRDAEALALLLPAFHQELLIASYQGAPTRELRKVAERLARIVTRCTIPVDAGTLADGTPGCVSCARTTKEGRDLIGGHYAPVWEKRPAPSLCYRCYEARGRLGTLPPIMWCHLLHTQDRTKADRWLARQHPDLYAKGTEKPARICRTPIVVDGEHGACGRPFMHEGRCELVRVGT